MSMINGLSPGCGASAENRFSTMPLRHDGRAHYNEARCMPSKGRAGPPTGLRRRLITS